MAMTHLQIMYQMELDKAANSPSNDFFRNSELAELPPKLRAVFEENRVGLGGAVALQRA